MNLFFDSETTGLPKSWKAPVWRLDNWPRLVQLAYLFYDDNGELLESGNLIVKPVGFIIPPEAARIHGITTERAMNEGEPIQDVLNKFANIVSISRTLIAHNMAFDENIVGSEFLRNGMMNYLEEKKKICTMVATTEFCKLPGNFGTYKWAKLSELHYILFGTDFEEAHNAAVDIQITAKCYWELKRIGIL